MKPLVSVIVPAYNSASHIEKCLEHLIHQTHKELEIIVVDDGSTDNTSDIVSAYASSDSRIKLIRQANGGPSKAQNTGIKAATGTYLHIHDHDDYAALDFFEKMVDAAEMSGADIACSEVIGSPWSFPFFDTMRILVTQKDKIIETGANHCNPAWRYLYRMDFIRRNNLLFEEAAFNDQDMLFTKPAVVLAGKIVTVPGARYYNINLKSSFSHRSKRFLRKINDTPECREAHARYYRFLKEHDVEKYFKAPEKVEHSEQLMIFNVPVWRKDFLGNKTRSYILGIPLGTRHRYDF